MVEQRTFNPLIRVRISVGSPSLAVLQKIPSVYIGASRDLYRRPCGVYPSTHPASIASTNWVGVRQYLSTEEMLARVYSSKTCHHRAAIVEGSYNGSTWDFDSQNLGSSPSPSAINKRCGYDVGVTCHVANVNSPVRIWLAAPNFSS